MSSPLNVHLEHYEGPLDLLLDLIRKQQINVYDIPIATITSQYLEYMQKALELDFELGAEFVYMAATLIHIKSRMLLPRDPELEKIAPEEDPRRELVERLLEHERFKNAAEMLQQKRLVEEAIWSNPQMEKFVSEEDSPGLAVNLFDLVKTLQEVLERSKNRPVYEIGKEDVSVPEMLQLLRAKLEANQFNEPISALKLFESQRSQRAMICLFLAILELVKLQAVVLVQSEAFGDIALKKHENFEAAFSSNEDLSAIENEYS
ncbi:MAG: segregation/condensation protein A [Acidobacteria bacterium]|nr:segregation/condensation protein A [Acidobacteriota bacterium]